MIVDRQIKLENVNWDGDVSNFSASERKTKRFPGNLHSRKVWRHWNLRTKLSFWRMWSSQNLFFGHKDHKFLDRVRYHKFIPLQNCCLTHYSAHIATNLECTVKLICNILMLGIFKYCLKFYWRRVWSKCRACQNEV